MLDERDKDWLQSVLATKEELRELQRVASRTENRLERAEDTILTELHRIARSVELRLRTHEAGIASLQQRMNDLSDRIAKLEDRK